MWHLTLVRQAARGKGQVHRMHRPRRANWTSPPPPHRPTAPSLQPVVGQTRGRKNGKKPLMRGLRTQQRRLTAAVAAQHGTAVHATAA